PGRQITPADSDLRDAADKAVQRKPVQSLLHRSSVDRPVAGHLPPSLGCLASALSDDLEVFRHDLVEIVAVDAIGAAGEPVDVADLHPLGMPLSPLINTTASTRPSCSRMSMVRYDWS